MDEAQAIHSVIVGVSALLVVITPIIKLNNSITRLTTTLQFMNEENKRQDDRLNSHSAKLDDHENRITKLEK